ncbi:MAG: hypothetical protein ACXWCY_05140 [Burkholderiales bacterium]
MNDDRLLAFLGDSLELWGVNGTVEPGEAPTVAAIRAHTGTIVWIERICATDMLFRWAVRWRSAGDVPGGARELRPKPCSSLVGLLSAVRSALGVDRGSPVRIAPEPGALPFTAPR